MKWIKFIKNGTYKMYPLKNLSSLKIHQMDDNKYGIYFNFLNAKGLDIEVNRTDKENFIVNFEYFILCCETIFEVNL